MNNEAVTLADKPTGGKLSSRKVYIDFLRIVAIFLVLFHHSNFRGFMLFFDRQGIMRWVYSFLSIFCEIAVPLFFMLSGGLLLKKEESLKSILKNRVLRFLVVLFAVTVVYHFYDIVFNEAQNNGLLGIIDKFMTNSASGALWYMYTLIGLLLCLPFLRAMVKHLKAKDYLYLICLQILFTGLLPIVSYLLSGGSKYYIDPYSVVLATAMGFFFFLIGHFFENVADDSLWSLKNCLILSAATVVSVLLCAKLTEMEMAQGRFTDSTTSGFHYSLVAIPTFAVYFWAKYLFTKFTAPNWLSKVIFSLGNSVFVIYLLERILRERLLFVFDYFDGFCPRIVACGIWIVTIVAVGYAIARLLKLIPGVKKFI